MSASWCKVIPIIGLIAVLSAPLGVARAQEPSASAGAPASPVGGPDASYVLGPDDEIEVDVLGRSDFKTRGHINQDGTIQLPYIGATMAANHTVTQFSAEVAAALEKGGYFEHPIVSVDIVSYASRYVTVLGYVGHPGLLPIDRNYRLSEVVAKVGGATAEGADYVILRPINGSERKYMIKDLAIGDLNSDPYVNPGDKIYIPKGEIFYITGQVRSPGTYPLVADMTLRMAISRGGGVTDLGSISHAKVTRGGKVAHIKLEDMVQPGDIIDIGEKLF